MKNTIYLTLALFAIVLFGGNNLYANENPTDKGDGLVFVNIDTDGLVRTVSLAECCDDVLDFDAKLNLTLQVMRSGYGKEVQVHNAGNIVFYDFVEKYKVARLVVNKEENTLMMMQRELDL